MQAGLPIIINIFKLSLPANYRIHEKKILILCTGNSCRSQMAQGWLQSFDKNLIVRSAGTDPAGEVNPLAIKTMKNSGIDISSHTPESVERYLDEPWD